MNSLPVILLLSVENVRHTRGAPVREVIKAQQTDRPCLVPRAWVVPCNELVAWRPLPCGTGDIRAMLETGNLSGKCADLSSLFVGLARSVGLPARDVFGIRVADSRFGYKSLGKSGDISKAQHCRAEVWLSGFGWVPVDPADVRKVVLEEKPGLSLGDPLVLAAV